MFSQHINGLSGNPEVKAILSFSLFSPAPSERMNHSIRSGLYNLNFFQKITINITTQVHGSLLESYED